MTDEIAYARLRFYVEGADGHDLDLLAVVRLVGRHLTGTRVRFLLDQAAIGRASPDDAMVASEFTTGMSRRLPPTSIAHGESLVTISGLAADPPVRAWAMEHRYPAFSQDVRLSWLLSVGVEEVRENLFSVAVRIAYRAENAVYAQAITPDTDISLWELLDDASIRVSLDGEALLRTPVFIGTDLSVHEFVTLLERPDRHHLSYVLISRESEMDTAKILTEIAGYANVYVPASASVERSFGDILPVWLGRKHPVILFSPGLGLHGGSLLMMLQTLHQPPLPTDEEESALTETERVMAQLTALTWRPPNKVVEDALIRLLRFPSPVPVREPAPIDSVAALTRRIESARFNHLLTERAFDADLAKEYDQEIEDLGGRLAAATTSIEERDYGLLEMEARHRALDHDNARLAYERAQLVERLEAARSSSPAAFRLETLPSSLPEVLALGAELFGERLVVTEQAMLSAAKTRFRDLPAAWKCLREMAETLHPLHFKEKLYGRALAARFRDVSGFELASHESESTRVNARLASLRTVLYHGALVDISSHIKVGRVKECLRVHYFLDPTDERLVIGHFGDHLETSKM